MKNLHGKTALITGASSGIGEAFAYELARNGVDLIITARSLDKLNETAKKIRENYPVRVHVFSGDLTKKETPSQLFNQVTGAGLSVDLLINNAGFGKWANFLEEGISEYEDMIEINITALMKLTYVFLPAMLKNKTGGIINIASTGALQPCPYVAAYCASKSFVSNFSEALHGEYNHKGITVTAICPGNTITNFQNIAKANTKGMKGDTPQKVAQEGIKALMKNKSFKIIGTANYLQSFLSRILPRKQVIKIVANMMNKKVNN